MAPRKKKIIQGRSIIHNSLHVFILKNTTKKNLRRIRRVVRSKAGRRSGKGVTVEVLEPGTLTRTHTTGSFKETHPGEDDEDVINSHD
jgi:hypothetical protein